MSQTQKEKYLFDADKTLFYLDFPKWRVLNIRQANIR